MWCVSGVKQVSTPEPVTDPPGTQGPLEDDLQEVWRSSGPSLYRQALAITGDPQAAEDVVQEAFVRVWRRRARLRDPKAVGAYLSRAVRNVAFDLLRRHKAAGKALAGKALLVVPAVEPAETTRDEARAEAARVSAALLKLPPEQREVVQLRIHEGCPFKEVAERTGVPLGTVHSRYRYAMKRLRSLLGLEEGRS